MESHENNKRKEKDIMRLLVSKYEVELINNKMNDFYVKFQGPEESPYKGVSSV
jgi:ubiquitin-conjugating enzyme E2 H